MNGTLRGVRKKAMGENPEQSQNPEEVFKDSVKQVAMEYLKSKFPYLLEYPGELKVSKIDLDNNSMIMSYALYSDGTEPLGEVPLLYSNGKIVEPWAIFVNSEKSMKPLSQDWVAKLFDNKSDSNGSVTTVTDTVPSRAMNDNESTYRTDTLTGRNIRRYAALNRLRLTELSAFIKSSHKDAKLYMDAGRLATKIAASRLIKSKPIVSDKVTVQLKQGCLAISNVEELNRVSTDSKTKKAALEDYYGNGGRDVFIFGDDTKDNFTDITTKVNETHKFEAENLYIEILANQRPVICAINKETGKEMFFVKKDSNEASLEVSREYTMTREIKKDDVIKRWNKPEHSLVAVAPLDWKDKYKELLEKEKVSDDAMFKKIVEAAVKGQSSIKGSGAGAMSMFVVVPEKPVKVSRGDYGYAVTVEIYPNMKSFDPTFRFSDDLFPVDISEYSDGMLTTKKGERFYVIKASGGNKKNEGVAMEDALRELSERASIFIDSPDNCFVTKASQKMSPIGYSFLSKAMTLDDAAKLTVWVKKTGSNKFAMGISETVLHDGQNVIIPKSIGTVPRKTAGILLGLAGKRDGLADFLDSHPSNWHRYTSKSKSAFLRKIAQNPEMATQLLGDIVQQAKAMGGSEEGVTINIENLHLAVPDLASGVAEGTAQAAGTTSGETGATEGVMQELVTLGVPQEAIDVIMNLSEVTGTPPEEMLGTALEFVKKRTTEGVPVEQTVSEMVQMAEEQLAKVIQGAPAQGAPAQEAPIQEAPIQGAPIQGAPIQGAPAQGAPIQGAPAQEVPIQGAPAPEAPIQGAPIQGAPVPEAPAPEAPAQGATPPLPELIQALLGLGISQQTVDMLQQVAQAMQIAPEQLIIEAGKYAEEALNSGSPIEQVDADIMNNIQQMMQTTSPEMVQAAGVPVAQAAASVPMSAEQEQGMVQAGQQINQAVPATPAQTPVYDTANRIAANPGMEGYEEEMNTTREGSLIADIIGNAVVKTKFFDYLPTLNDTMNTVAELILKIELGKSTLMNDVGADNVDKVLSDLRDVNQMIGNLILKIGSFE